MQIITKSEIEKIEFKASYATLRTPNPVVAEVLRMQVGEGLLIKKDEWKLKSSPSNLLYARRGKLDNKKFSQKRLADESGWVLLRVE